MAGYTTVPLIRKLGIKEGVRLLLVNAPAGYLKLTGRLPRGVELVSSNAADVDIIQFFATSMEELEFHLPALAGQMKHNGMLWVSWYKKAAGIPTDVTEDYIRQTAIALGLVDIKVCAIDDRWSALKLVYRKSNR